MEKRMIKVGMLYRQVTLTREDINESSREVEVSFSSEVKIDRFFGSEILDHAKESVRLDRINNGGALLEEHDTDRQVGVVEKATIGPDRKGRATVRFGKSARASELFQDVVDGIRRSISVGYRIYKAVLEEVKDDVETFRVMDWEPLEVSLVAIPADVSVGVGRSRQEDERDVELIDNTEEKMEPKKEGTTTTPAPITEPAVNVDSIRSEAKDAERNRLNEIMAIGERFKCAELARNHANEGTTVEAFRAVVLEKIGNAKPVTQDPEIGMSGPEMSRYSLVAAIRQVSEAGRLDGLEKEASDAVAKRVKREPKGFFIPHDVMDYRDRAAYQKRVMQVADPTKGGFLVGADVLASSMIELLRNKAVVAMLGATQLGGLVGNVLIPRITGGGTAYWLPETGGVTASDQALGQLALAPKRLAADTAYTKELLMQASVDVEGFIRNDLMRILAIAKDLAAINGLGANGQPLGILNVTGTGGVTFGGAPTWAKVVEFETDVADSNAEAAVMAYLTTPAVRGKWKTTVKESGQALYLWDGGTVNGYRAETTKQVPSNKVIFGNWGDLMMADWAGVDVVVDPFSLKKSGQVEITITLHTDIGVRHAESFSVSSDSGAQ